MLLELAREGTDGSAPHDFASSFTLLPWKNKQEEEVIHNSGEINTCGVASTSALCGLAPIVYGVGDAML